MQNNISSSPAYCAIVLAGGVSRRMGTCKASLAWGEGKTLQSRPTEVYQKLLRSQIAHQSLITAPCHQGKLGHPLFFAKTFEKKLWDCVKLSENFTLKFSK